VGEKGTPIEGVKTKSVTISKLNGLAKRFDETPIWVKINLTYLKLSILAEERQEMEEKGVKETRSAKQINDETEKKARIELATWLFGDLEDNELPRGSIRRADHMMQLCDFMQDRRFNAAMTFHGARWISLDEQSEKRAGEDLNLLLLIEGTSAAGWLVPPNFITVQTRDGRTANRPVRPVVFDIAKWNKRGSWERNVRFEGDTDPPPKEGEPRRDTPIRDLCSALSVHIEDLERTVSNMILYTQEEPWVPLDYQDKFRIGMSIPMAIRDRIVGSGLGVDLVAEKDVKVA